jgi:hypothetical protein
VGEGSIGTRQDGIIKEERRAFPSVEFADETNEHKGQTTERCAGENGSEINETEGRR